MQQQPDCDCQLKTPPRFLPCKQSTWSKPLLLAALPVLQPGTAQDILLLNTEVTESSYLASLVLSLSSFPHSQSFPGSTAKCKGSNLCSESVRGITAEAEKKQGLGWGKQKGQKRLSCEKQNHCFKKGRICAAELPHPEHHKWFILGSWFKLACFHVCAIKEKRERLIHWLLLDWMTVTCGGGETSGENHMAICTVQSTFPGDRAIRKAESNKMLQYSCLSLRIRDLHVC